jgi:putative FmdB family regulatory protein
MPIYEYRCPDGHQFEVFQHMTDDPVTACQVCGKPVERVFHPVAVHFKGSGFYTTDYAKKKSVGGGGSQDGAGKESGSGGDSGSKESKSSDSGSKPEKAKTAGEGS